MFASAVPATQAVIRVARHFAVTGWARPIALSLGLFCVIGAMRLANVQLGRFAAVCVIGGVVACGIVKGWETKLFSFLRISERVKQFMFVALTFAGMILLLNPGAEHLPAENPPLAKDFPAENPPLAEHFPAENPPLAAVNAQAETNDTMPIEVKEYLERCRRRDRFTRQERSPLSKESFFNKRGLDYLLCFGDVKGDSRIVPLLGRVALLLPTETKILQIIDDERALVRVGSKTLMAVGWPMHNKVDDDRLTDTFDGAKVTGTTAYEAAMGGRRTVLVIQPFDLERWVKRQIEDEWREVEDERRKKEEVKGHSSRLLPKSVGANVVR